MFEKAPAKPAAQAQGTTYVFDDHDKEGELDSKGLPSIARAADEVG